MSIVSESRSLRPGVLRFCLLAGLTTCSLYAVAQQPLPPLNPRDMAMTIPGDFTLASVGDLMMRRPASRLADDAVQAALRLIREADLAVGNMEGELANLQDFDGPLNGFVGSHEVAADLKAIGFDFMSFINYASREINCKIVLPHRPGP